MIGARSGEEQRFATRVPPIVVPLHQQRADRLGTSATARFARRDDVDPAFGKHSGQRADLRRFANPFAALERDETPPHRPASR